MKSVAIIGAGITGLTAAFYLKRKGMPVTVYEASERVGGVIQSIRQGRLPRRVRAEYDSRNVAQNHPARPRCRVGEAAAGSGSEGRGALRGALQAADRDARLAAGVFHHETVFTERQAGRAARAVRAGAAGWRGGEHCGIRGAPVEPGISRSRHRRAGGGHLCG